MMRCHQPISLNITATGKGYAGDIHKWWRVLTRTVYDLTAVGAARIPSDGATAAAEDVERGEGGLLDPLPLVMQRPAFLRHGIPRALHLRVDLAVAPRDLAAHRRHKEPRHGTTASAMPSRMTFARINRCSPAHLEHALETSLHLLRHVCAQRKKEQFTPVLASVVLYQEMHR